MNETRIRVYETDEKVTYVIDGDRDTMSRITSKWTRGRLEILSIEDYNKPWIKIIE